MSDNPDKWMKKLEKEMNDSEEEESEEEENEEESEEENYEILSFDFDE